MSSSSGPSFCALFTRFLAFSSLRPARFPIAGLKKTSSSWQGSAADCCAADERGPGDNCGGTTPTTGPAHKTVAAAAAIAQLSAASRAAAVSPCPGTSGPGFTGAPGFGPGPLSDSGSITAGGTLGSSRADDGNTLFVPEEDEAVHAALPGEGSRSSGAAGHIVS